MNGNKMDILERVNIQHVEICTWVGQITRVLKIEWEYRSKHIILSGPFWNPKISTVRLFKRHSNDKSSVTDYRLFLGL